MLFPNPASFPYILLTVFNSHRKSCYTFPTVPFSKMPILTDPEEYSLLLTCVTNSNIVHPQATTFSTILFWENESDIYQTGKRYISNPESVVLF